ncbi:hemagglutinin repeat-containing protein [Helicobacter sp. 13S00477-4]|uniref:hemagglutinin repeat-containing protein n=1 Tax=Helicobacter sp. 13S00477-4 TaxID=1905759 RepID=UPI000BA7BA6F|nr:hemagglutinin repeat-containing protein [Helicobacter sp. 13S00477-4]PAF50487.1 hypothetical protein BKH44_08000 [Helicobacter sp. 13S00477-4]
MKAKNSYISIRHNKHSTKSLSARSHFMPYIKLAVGLISISLASSLSALDTTTISNPALPKPLPLTPDTTNNAFAPQVIKAHNNIPIVNITTPNAAGISNNAFKDFNVNQNGLIFNNIKDSPSLTQLSGYINSNPNLNHSSTAKLILNQITSSHPSTLLGYMEIGGDKANLIIANPNGITCDGCGFINTANSTMIAGELSKKFNEQFLMMKNMQDALKSLKFLIKDGSINIGAFNGKNLQAINLISRTLSVNGKIDASKITMILGQNNITLDPNNASVLLFQPVSMPTDESVKTQKPALALDVAYMGGVYANSIYLVASEKGVGVKNSGTLATFPSRDGHDGGFIIHSNGDIEITKATREPIVENAQHIEHNTTAPIELNTSTPIIYAGGDLHITAPNIKNQSIIFGEKNISMTTTGNIDNIGQMELESKILSKEHHYSRDGGDDKNSTYDYMTTTTQDELKAGSYHPAIIYAKGSLNLIATLINNTSSIIATPKGELINHSNLNNTTPTPKRTEESVGTRTDYDRTGGKCGVWGFFTVSKWNCHSSTTHHTYHPAPKVSTLSIEDLHIPTIPLEKMMSEYVSTMITNYNATPHTYGIDTDPIYHTPNAFLHTDSFQASISDSALLSAMMDKTDIDNHLNAIQANPFSPTSVGIGITANSAYLLSTPMSDASSLYNTSAIAAGSLYLSSDNITNTNGTIYSSGDMDILAKSFSSDSSKLQANGNININAKDVSIKTTSTSNANALYNCFAIPFINGKNTTRCNTDSTSSNTMLNATSIMRANNIFINSENTNINGAEFLGNAYINSASINIGTAMAASSYIGGVTHKNTTTQKGSIFKNGYVGFNSSRDMYLMSLSIDNEGFNTFIKSSGKLTIDTATNTYNNTITTNFSHFVDKENDVLDNQIKSNDVSISSFGDMNLTSLKLFSTSNVDFSSENNITFIGVKANALGNMNVYSGANLDMKRMGNIKTSNKVVFNDPTVKNIYRGFFADKILSGKEDTQLSANNISIDSNNATMKAVSIDANNDLDIKTKNLNVDTIATRIDEIDRNKISSTTTNDISTIRTKNIHIDSDNVKMTSMDIKANKDISIKARGNILIDTTLNTTYTKESTTETKNGFLSKKTTTTTTTEKTATNLANTINAEHINISAGGSTTVYNLISNSKDLNIFSGGDTILSNKADSHTKITNTYTETTGFAGSAKNGKLSVSYGKDTRDETLTDSTAKHHNQTIVSDNINLISSSGDVKVESSDLKADFINLKGKNVLVNSLDDSHTINQDVKTTSDRVGIALEVPTEVGDMISNKNNILTKTVGKTILDYTGKIYGFKTISNFTNSNIEGKNIKDMYGTLKSDLKSSIQNPKISVGYHHTDSHMHTSTVTKVASSSSIFAKSLNIDSKNDTNIIGSDVNAASASIVSNNFNISSAKESTDMVSSVTSKDIDVTLNAQIKGRDTNANLDAKYQKSKNSSSNSLTTSRGSNLNIGTLDVKASGDTAITGSYLNTNTANIDTKNFTLASSKNTSSSNEETDSYGGEIEFSYNGGYNGKLKGNYSQSNMHEDIATYQGSIFNTKSLKLNTVKNTNLIGSALNIKDSGSISTANLNILATQNKHNSSFDSKHIEGSIEGGYGYSGVSLGGGISGGLSHSNSNATTHNNAILSGGNLNITTTKDVTLTGGSISTNSLDANIGKNLSISSLNDTNSSTSAILKAGMKGGYNIGSDTGVHPDFDFKISNNSVEEVSQISGISSNDLNVSVNDTISLKGSYINSTSPATSTLNTNKIIRSSVSNNSHTLNLTKNNLPSGSYEHTDITSGIVGVNITANSGDTTNSPQKTNKWSISSAPIPIDSISEMENKTQEIVSSTQSFSDKFSEDKGIKKIGDMADYFAELYKKALPNELKSQLNNEINKKKTQATNWAKDQAQTLLITPVSNWAEKQWKDLIK